jgi:hypothetical protein
LVFAHDRPVGSELRRVFLVGGCVAAAATANFAGDAFPERAPVAVGAAILGALLLLRRRPSRTSDEPVAVEADGESLRVDSTESRSKRWTRRRSRSANIAALEARSEHHQRELLQIERRLTALGGRQTVLDLRARDDVADLNRRVRDLEEAQKQYQQAREREQERLTTLYDALGMHRAAISDLKDSIQP